MLLRDVELDGVRRDVRLAAGRITEIGRALDEQDGETVVACGGGALVAGLHDHHLHVHALAAAHASVAVGPDTTPDAEAFVGALRAAAANGPVRAIAYHERVAGDLDRDVLDRAAPDVAVRVQHRSGVLWVLNSAALDALGARAADPRVERDAAGRATGRVWRGDELLRGVDVLPSIDAIGRELARLGVTSLTDATATNDTASAAALAVLPQRVRVMGPLALECDATAGVELGEVKVLLDDDALPVLDDTVASIRAAHARGRGVAFHCVTLVQARFAIEALRCAGVLRDRIEHASVAPPDVVADLVALGASVATQPAFVVARGDDYLRDVDPRDVAALYPVASLLRAGVPTLGSSDAPYGPLDPWAAMRAAVTRRTASGTVLGATERIDGRDALALYSRPGGVAVGAPADLVVCGVALRDVVRRLDATDVVLTIVGGAIVHDAR